MGEREETKNNFLDTSSFFKKPQKPGNGAKIFNTVFLLILGFIFYNLFLHGPFRGEEGLIIYPLFPVVVVLCAFPAFNFIAYVLNIKSLENIDRVFMVIDFSGVLLSVLAFSGVSFV